MNSSCFDPRWGIGAESKTNGSSWQFRRQSQPESGEEKQRERITLLPLSNHSNDPSKVIFLGRRSLFEEGQKEDSGRIENPTLKSFIEINSFGTPLCI